MSVKPLSTTGDLMLAIKYPFSDKHWAQKILVGILLGIASLMIPLVPLVFLTGYYYRISRRIIAEDGVASLPDWDNWGKLFMDGLKYLGVTLIYCLPLFLTTLAMYLVMVIPMLTSMNPSASWNGYGSDPQLMKTIMTMLLMYPMIGLMMLISLATGIFMPPALMHMIARDSFSAAFQFTSWWKVFRANPGGFLLSYLILIALITVMYFGYYILVLTLILCFLTPLFLMFTSSYIGLVSAGMYAQAYRTGSEKLNSDQVMRANEARTGSRKSATPVTEGKKAKSRR